MADTQNEFKPLGELGLKFGDMVEDQDGARAVCVSSDGEVLMYEDAIKAYRPVTALFRRVTPQAPEPERLTLRDQVAIAAMPQIILACAQDTLKDGETRSEMFARNAHEIAVAYLAERNQGKGDVSCTLENQRVVRVWALGD